MEKYTAIKENKIFDNINQTTIRYAEYTYDNAGNTTQRTITDNGIPSTTSYTYYDDNRIHTVTLPSSELITFTYFADGSRATKESATEWITYHYAAGLVKEVHHLASDHNTTTFTLHYEPGRIIYEPYGGTPTTYYTVTDTQGTIYKLLDTQGTTLANYTYDPFGNRLTNSAPTIYNPIGFAGTYYDSETNLLYASSRYLDPTTSRFTTKDSYRGDLQSHISQNRYIYCHQNPISYSDPSGFAPIEGDNSYDTPTETTKAKTNHKEDPNPPKQGEIKPNDPTWPGRPKVTPMPGIIRDSGNSNDDGKSELDKLIDKAMKYASGFISRADLEQRIGKMKICGVELGLAMNWIGKLIAQKKAQEYEEYSEKAKAKGRTPYPKNVYEALKNKGLSQDEILNLDWVAWHEVESDYDVGENNYIKKGTILIVGYQVKNHKPIFYYGPYGPNKMGLDPEKKARGVEPGKVVKEGLAEWFENSWTRDGTQIYINTVNHTGSPIRIYQYLDYRDKYWDIGRNCWIDLDDQHLFRFDVRTGELKSKTLIKGIVIYNYKKNEIIKEDIIGDYRLSPGECVVIRDFNGSGCVGLVEHFRGDTKLSSISFTWIGDDVKKKFTPLWYRRIIRED